MKVKKNRLRWCAHVRRKKENSLVRSTMMRELPGRKRRGRPRKRWLDGVKEMMEESGLDQDIQWTKGDGDS